MPIEGLELRRVMGHFATGVTIVTSRLDGEPCAMTANSVTSVSLDPPLVLWCALATSVTLQGVRQSRYFAVNILDASKEQLARSFSVKGKKTFAGVGHHSAKSGAPVLEDCLAWLDCSVYAEYEGGDHVIILGRVEEAAVVGSGGPLIFYRGGYHRLVQ